MVVHVQVQTQRKLFTTNEYHQMLQAGIFDEDDGLELIEGAGLFSSPVGAGRVGPEGRIETRRRRLPPARFRYAFGYSTGVRLPIQSRTEQP